MLCKVQFRLQFVLNGMTVFSHLKGLQSCKSSALIGADDVDSLHIILVQLNAKDTVLSCKTRRKDAGN